MFPSGCTQTLTQNLENCLITNKEILLLWDLMICSCLCLLACFWELVLTPLVCLATQPLQALPLFDRTWLVPALLALLLLVLRPIPGELPHLSTRAVQLFWCDVLCTPDETWFGPVSGEQVGRLRGSVVRCAAGQVWA